MQAAGREVQAGVPGVQAGLGRRDVLQGLPGTGHPSRAAEAGELAAFSPLPQEDMFNLTLHRADVTPRAPIPTLPLTLPAPEPHHMLPKPCRHGLRRHGQRRRPRARRKTRQDWEIFVCAMFRADAARPSGGLLLASAADLRATNINAEAALHIGIARMGPVTHPREEGPWGWMGRCLRGQRDGRDYCQGHCCLCPLGTCCLTLQERAKVKSLLWGRVREQQGPQQQGTRVRSSKSGSGSGLERVVRVRHSPRATQQ